MFVSRVGKGSRNQEVVGFLPPGREPSENLGTIKCPPWFTTGDQGSRAGNALAQSHVANLCQSWGLLPSIGAITLSCDPPDIPDKSANFPGPQFPHLEAGTIYAMPAYLKDYDDSNITFPKA